MQRAALILMIFLCVSCDFFDSRAEKTQKIIEQEMGGIDWNAIDQFPLFEGCDELASKEVQKKCFEEMLLLHYSEILGDFEFVLDRKIKDTIRIDVLIDNKGLISILHIEQDSIVNSQIPGFNGIITRGIKSLPKLKPALKRGIPVKAKFRIPLVINTK
ncbi:MAG: hypothetical protein ACSHW4_12530 [Cellulophaga sp.]|uniref:hypothetical protein n=2 Tax=unclassified Cellulophaga TaxID=2634405 RepID=UPI000C2CD702|nr:MULTISPECIES: hypothetical protein [unclassified Cellulophaga]MDO6490221.1 hypothetical protein [Cellulophaga sp. 2_MG-2023]MDO6494585.1 hypothetical protein [Cellulophaga sp. 3_MG-2023]PKB42171.1 hypothetical protein AX016_0333 [Cellulophaga sp. RHA19]